MRRATIDKLPVSKIAFWNPYRQTWALPPDLSEDEPRRARVSSGRRRVPARSPAGTGT